MKPSALAAQLEKTSFPGITQALKEFSVNGVETKNIVFELSCLRRILSTRDGFCRVRTVIENCCPESLWGYVHRNPESFRTGVQSAVGVTADESAFLYTGADIDCGVLSVIPAVKRWYLLPLM